MQVAICDDDFLFRADLRNYLITYKTEKRIHIDIYEFNSGREFLDCDLVFDIVFLDFQMPDLNGLETARQLRLKNSICSIVFITSYSNFFIRDAFEVNTFRFFDKPIFEDDIYTLLDVYISHQRKLAPIIINDSYAQKTIASKDIIYLEGDGKYCTIRTTTETVHSSKTLAGVLQVLPQYCFCRTHKSYAVNLYYIACIQDNCVYLTNGEKANIGRSYLYDFKKTYKNFIKNYFVRL